MGSKIRGKDPSGEALKFVISIPIRIIVCCFLPDNIRLIIEFDG